MTGGASLEELLTRAGARRRPGSGRGAAWPAGTVEGLVSSARALSAAGVPRDSAVAAFFVPGRIEVLGKHTDYAGGRSLLAAVERGFCVVAATRGDGRIVVMDARDGGSIAFPLAADLPMDSPGWPAYPMVVARRIARNFPDARSGIDMAFASDLPRAAGMSSSSALVVATFLALSEANRLPSTDVYRRNIQSGEELAVYLAAIENGRDYRSLAGAGGVGTQGGSEDHVAILCARPGALIQYAFDPVTAERVVPMPPGCTFAVGSSGVVAEKTGAARNRYNRAAEQMRLLAELWRSVSGRDEATIGAALAADPAAADRLEQVLRSRRTASAEAEGLAARLHQFVAETRDIVPAAAEALAAGRLARFGELVDASQRLAEGMLGNQVPETIHLARSARECGALAASAFGAGFGGSVWAMVERETAGDFLTAWRSRYLDRHPARAAGAEFFLTDPSGPAGRLA